MLDFFFIQRHPRDQFELLLKQKEVAYLASTTDDGYLLSIPEETQDELLDELEASYSNFLDMDRDLFEEQELETGSTTAGVSLNLASGESVQAEVPVELLNRILSVIDTHELAEFVDAIVDAVESPNSDSLCRRRIDSQK